MIKKTRFVLALGVASLVANAYAHEVGSHLYLNFDAGGAVVQDVRIKDGDTIKFNPGGRIDAGLGWRISEPLSVEFETGVAFNSVDKIGGVAVSSYGGNADIYQIPLLVNLVYTPPLKSAIKPFIGIGAGGIGTVADMQTPLGNINDTDFTFAYQAVAGVKWTLSKHAEINLDYKFLGSFDHSWSSGGVTLRTESIFTHSLLLSFSWKF
jgi:opacity protein-like surface antigen